LLHRLTLAHSNFGLIVVLFLFVLPSQAQLLREDDGDLLPRPVRVRGGAVVAHGDPSAQDAQLSLRLLARLLALDGIARVLLVHS
jgi:hypothetical protein